MCVCVFHSKVLVIDSMHTLICSVNNDVHCWLCQGEVVVRGWQCLVSYQPHRTACHNAITLAQLLLMTRNVSYNSNTEIIIMSVICFVIRLTLIPRSDNPAIHPNHFIHPNWTPTFTILSKEPNLNHPSHVLQPPPSLRSIPGATNVSHPTLRPPLTLPPGLPCRT